jgi:hydroxymethylpyrimidine pyrophosphatase-like HAD family hydrolase/adenine/guanine phosphoribosyltransferase-like PRPP-binding protein
MWSDDLMNPQPTSLETETLRAPKAIPALEEGFYAQYAWCLNPMRSVRDLLDLLAVELGRYSDSEVDWQKQERGTNIYLLSCAISTTVADHLAPRLPEVKKVPGLGRFRGAALIAYEGLQFAHRLRNRLRDGEITSWLLRWNECVDLAAQAALGESDAVKDAVLGLKIRVVRLSQASLPHAVLNARMQLPFGLREQDLTLPDIAAMANLLTNSHPPSAERVLVLGLRTAGAYFAPIVARRLLQSGWSASVTWTSVRPKKGLSAQEAKTLREAARRGARVLVVDDQPDTGETLKLVVDLLERYGIARRAVTIMVPTHPAQRDPMALRGGYADLDLVAFRGECSWKHRFLASDQVSRLLGEYYRADGWGQVKVRLCQDSRSVELADQSHGFHARLKRLYEVKASRGSSESLCCHVIAKDVGCGWLGYHAYLAGTRLKPYVPRVLGLRNGFLFSEWVPASQASDEKPSVTEVAHYVAERASRLAINEDPCFSSPGCGGTFWYTLLKTLRRVYGPHLGRMKMSALHRALVQYMAPRPAFIDGNMAVKDWVRGRDEYRKVDYEHHAFGNPGLNVVDPAFDLASAAFEFDLGRHDEEKLLSIYISATGDTGIGERLILHKIVRGVSAREAAQHRLRRAQSYEEQLDFHARDLAARDFLTLQLAQFLGKPIAGLPPDSWTSRIFVLDLDGVFDTAKLLFPHTTFAGLQALALLKESGFSVVVNSGRSARYAREYCAAYGLAGGIAEHGAVYIDAVGGREVSLLTESESLELETVRERARARKIFLDPTYEFAVRIHESTGGRPSGLSPEFCEELVRDCRHLRSLSTPVDTYVVPASKNKGTGLKALLNDLQIVPTISAAAGDSDADLDVFAEVEHAYAPANCSRGIRDYKRTGQCRVMEKSFQGGLLLAVKDLLRRTHGSNGVSKTGCVIPQDHLLNKLVAAADSGPAGSALAGLKWWSV